VSVAELEGGTLTSSAGDSMSPLVQPLHRGVERGGVGELVVGTLLGPEGTGRLCCFGGEGRVGNSGGLHARRTARDPGSGGGGCGATSRTLRTAQWTRASSKILLVGMYLDIRADPRTDEGLVVVSFGGWWLGSCCVWWVGVGVCVAKLLRAHGGCLGTRSR
jgi:hypothetical protein